MFLNTDRKDDNVFMIRVFYYGPMKVECYSHRVIAAVFFFYRSM